MKNVNEFVPIIVGTSFVSFYPDKGLIFLFKRIQNLLDSLIDRRRRTFVFRYHVRFRLATFHDYSFISVQCLQKSPTPTRFRADLIITHFIHVSVKRNQAHRSL